MKNIKRFILIDCGNRDSHMLHIDDIQRVSPLSDKGHMITKVVLTDGTELYTAEKVKDIFDKIQLMNV